MPFGKELADARDAFLVAGESMHLPFVVDERQAELGMGECEACELLADMSHLGTGGSQKFPAGRELVEDVTDLDCGADVATARTDGALIAAIDFDAMGLIGFRGPADRSHLGDGGDAGERLASKSEGGDAVEVVAVLDFARRMGGEGGLKIVGVHADAVVGDGNQLATAVFDRNGDFRRTGIDAVLHEFLDHAGGAFDNLASRDHVYHVLVKVDDSAHDPGPPPIG